MAGDMRVNEHPFLATLHVVFAREHNRLAKLLREYLPPKYRTVSTSSRSTLSSSKRHLQSQNKGSTNFIPRFVYVLLGLK